MADILLKTVSVYVSTAAVSVIILLVGLFAWWKEKSVEGFIRMLGGVVILYGSLGFLIVLEKIKRPF